MNHYFLMTIDVEDWFQVENFKQYIPYASWSSYELRVEKNIHRLLDLLDSTGSKKSEVRMQKSASNDENQASPIQNPDNGQQSTDDGQDEKVRGTFFVLGWLAERLPHLVQEIHSRGHEIASHGYYHRLCNEQSHEDLKTDLCNSKSLLEDIIGNQVYGYRAPSFAINNDILKIIEDCGYLYDSSYNSFALHGRYGQVSLSRNGTTGIAFRIPKTFTPLNGFSQYLTGADPKTRNTKPETFYELSISNINVFKSVLPWGGGGYFRLIPFPLFKLGVESILKKENAYLFYMHPWEIDADQPRVNDASPFYRFRHYSNLSKTHSKLLKLIENFVHCNFITCSQYLNEVMKSAL